MKPGLFEDELLLFRLVAWAHSSLPPRDCASTKYLRLILIGPSTCQGCSNSTTEKFSSIRNAVSRADPTLIDTSCDSISGRTLRPSRHLK